MATAERMAEKRKQHDARVKWRGTPLANIKDDESEYDLLDEMREYHKRRAVTEGDDFRTWATSRGLTGDVLIDEQTETKMPKGKFEKLTA